MSESEIRHRGGLGFGGMPHDTLLRKLEETDPALVARVRGADGSRAPDDYDDYARGEIVDWGPDAPFLESDQTRRDAGLSRSMINLRYNGTRGSDPTQFRNPEFFYGFTDRDPRGTGNDPRFDHARGHLAARAGGLVARMGKNDDNHLAERPWTGQSISYAMKEVHRRQKANTRIFTTQKEGRPLGNNTVFDAEAARDLRAATMAAGGESLGPGRFAADQFNEARSDGVRGVDAGRFAGAEVAPWRHTTGDADLGVQLYGQKRAAGRGDVAAAAQGGGRLNAAGADQAWAESERGRSTNRQALAATMALAARHRRAVKSGEHGQLPGGSYEAALSGGGLAPARDVAALYRHVAEGQARRPAGEVQDGDGAGAVFAAGLAPGARPERAGRAGVAWVTANAHLTNVGAIVGGLREGTAAGRRRIAGAVIADGARPDGVLVEAGTRRGAAPCADQGRIARLSEMPLTRAAASEGLVVHAYRGAAPPGRPERRAALAHSGSDAATWRASHEALPIGMSAQVPERRSGTQDPTVLGDAPDRVFGFDAEVAGYHGAGPMGGGKRLRAGSSSADLSDELGGFDA